jgi:hypothetical protein
MCKASCEWRLLFQFELVQVVGKQMEAGNIKSMENCQCLPLASSNLCLLCIEIDIRVGWSEKYSQKLVPILL